MKAHFTMFAHYNRWANERVYRAARLLSHADFHADQGAFFRSLAGTLNHILVADQVWMHRFTGEGQKPTRLDETLAEHLDELTTLRNAEDARIITFVEGLNEAALLTPLTYGPLTATGSFTQPLGALLAHFFNHQTHHRGQATVILTRLAGQDAVEPLDLAVFQRASGLGVVPD
ncbi:MAG TPA: DinB family protein [Kaistia sp.]|nr:DinB family protein [Kaistia sp.]